MFTCPYLNGWWHQRETPVEVLRWCAWVPHYTCHLYSIWIGEKKFKGNVKYLKYLKMYYLLPCDVYIIAYIYYLDEAPHSLNDTK